MEKIAFTDADTGKEIEFFVEETTTLNEIEYLLVTEAQDDSTAHIFKKISPADSEETSYEEVDDEEELEIISRVFMELMDDTEIEL